MADIQYLDFDLKITKTTQGYQAEVLDSPVGQATSEFKLPFSDLEIENFLLRIASTRGTMRRVESPEMQAAKDFGSRLFNAVFTGNVLGALTSSRYAADRDNVGVRVRLHLSDAPELASLPWEYLYNSSLNRFLALSVKSPLVRYLDLPENIHPLAVRPPLRVLAMISSPTDFEPLNVEGEFAKLKQGLSDLEQRDLLVLEREEDASLAALQKRLQQNDYHILHFIGHGGFDERTEDGVLIFEDGADRGRRVSAQNLGTILHDHDSLRLVILNACEGARTSRTDPFAGVAPTLVQQGIPAVIAMQFEISDDAAITFAQEFYCTLALGYPVDAALAEARKTIFANGNEIEWGTPVLYLRAPDGKIFNLEEAQIHPERSAQTGGAPPPESLGKAAPGISLSGRRTLWFAGGGTLVLLLCLLLFAGLSAAGVLPLALAPNTPTPTQNIFVPAFTPTLTPAVTLTRIMSPPSMTNTPAATPTSTRSPTPTVTRTPLAKPSPVVPKNLVACYTFSGNLDDDCGQHDAQASGIRFTRASDRKNLGVLEFSGSGSFGIISDSDDLDFGWDDFSIALWLKYSPKDPPSPSAILSKRAIRENEAAWSGIFLLADWHATGLTFGVDANNYLEARDYKWNDGILRHFVFIREKDILKIYMNGNLIASKSVRSISVSNTSPITLGANHSSHYNENLLGGIAGLRIYDRALTVDELVQIFKSEQ